MLDEDNLNNLLNNLKNLINIPRTEIMGRCSICEDGDVLLETTTSNNNCVALKVQAHPDHYVVTFAGGFKGDERFDLDLEPMVIHDVTEACVEIGTWICEHVDEDLEFVKSVIRDKWIDPVMAHEFVLEKQIEFSANEGNIL